MTHAGQRLEFRAMGCRMLAVLDSDSSQAAQWLARVPGWFAEWEQRLSRFRADSELSQLNRRSGSPVYVSAALWEVVEAALQAARDSGGLVVPTLLDALEAAGYDRTFEFVDQAHPPSRARRLTPSTREAWRAIECRASDHSISVPRGVRLDLGGIAKGWAADCATQRLSERGPALVDAGGDIAVSGPMTDGQPWPIGVADPLHPDRQAALLSIAQGGVATSGRDYRRWQRGGRWQHHILDPRTARPARTDVLSATVIAPTARQAEVAAKSALILGSRAGLNWLEQRPALAGMLALDDGRSFSSRRLEKHLWSSHEQD